MKDVKDRTNVWMPKALSGHAKLIPLRGSSVKKMINHLLELGLQPCAVKAKNTPSKLPFNNFNRVLYSGWVFYCKAEGLTMHHQLARIALLYFFYGTFQTKSGCAAPVIRCIHKMMQVVSYRFDSTIDSCFADIMKYINKKKKKFLKVLDDQGKNNVPTKYLALWEKGFRKAALTG